ncbi:MAG: hypothetical protein OXB88_10625 [Bacteriovoracales bacterium]|nr:hypothetical protein [Bacteriovoracales bacterium]
MNKIAIYILMVLVFLVASIGFSPKTLEFEQQLKELALRIFFCGLFLGLLFFYKYIHRFFFYGVGPKMSQKFYPSVNSADTVHYFSRILGFSIVFSSVQIYLLGGVVITIAPLFFRSLIIFLIYFVSLSISESIAFYQFTYEDEISKRKNLCYGVIHLCQSIALAFVIKRVIIVSDFFLPLGESFGWLFFLWLYASVIFGLAIKLFSSYSKLPFNKLVMEKNMALGISYSGYILGCALLVNSSLLKKTTDITMYLQTVGLKTLLIILILPLFIIGVKKVFLFRDHSGISGEYEFDLQRPEIGYGLYEGAIFLASSLMTTVIVDQIFFGNISPFLSFP